MTHTDTLLKLRQQAFTTDGDPRPLVVAHTSWPRDFSVFLRENVDGRFLGHLYSNGVLVNSEWSAAEDSLGYSEYNGRFRKEIIDHERALALKKLFSMVEATGPSCKDCIHQVSGECNACKLCTDFTPVPIIAKAKKETWPKFGMATAIMLKQTKKALA